MPTDTREQILDTAERLFAQRGIDGVSIRTITTEAQVNLAAIHYHFGSKEALVKEVFVRRIGAVNRERLRLLDECLERSGSTRPDLSELVRILVGPPLRLLLQAERGEIFTRLCGRIYAEASEHLRDMFVELFQEVFERFAAAFLRAAPEIPKTELMWRFHFVIGAMAHTLLQGDLAQQFSTDLAEPYDVEITIERLTQFAAAGLGAALPETSTPEAIKEGTGRSGDDRS